MTRNQRNLLGGLLLLAAIVGVFFWSGAIHWDREAPYTLAHSWGEPGSEPGQFNEPTGIAVSEREVFVADSRNARIQVFDKQGKFLRAFSEQLQRPMNLDIHDNRLFVADFFADAILVYSLVGRLLETIHAADGLKNPGGVAVKADGTLLVADTYRHRIVQLARDGRVLRSWGTVDTPGNGAGEFNYPTDLALTTDGGFYVADGYNDRVQQFDAEGEYVRRWGGPFGLNIHGPFKGWFATVTSIAVSADDSQIFVADFYHNRVQKFCDRGGYLTSFGTPSNSAIYTVIAIDVDLDGSQWVVNYAQHRVERWQQH